MAHQMDPALIREIRAIPGNEVRARPAPTSRTRRSLRA